MFDALDGFEATIHAFGTPAMHVPGCAPADAGHGVDPHAPPDAEHFHPFTPWDEHGDVPWGLDHSHDGDHHHAEHHAAPTAIGDPAGDGFTHQTTGFTCAVVSQKMILDRFGVVDQRTGQPVSEAQLVYDATVHGWLSDGGTSMLDMGRLLEFYGVPCHHGADWGQMVHELAAGHQVVLAVDARQLWSHGGGNSALHDLARASPNHALVIKGMKLDGAGHAVVVVNDPGQPHGAGVEYRLEEFGRAVDADHVHYISTDGAPPGWYAGPAHAQAANLAPVGAAGGAGGLPAHGGAEPFADFVKHMTADEAHAFVRSL